MPTCQSLPMYSSRHEREALLTTYGDCSFTHQFGARSINPEKSGCPRKYEAGLAGILPLAKARKKTQKIQTVIVF